MTLEELVQGIQMLRSDAMRGTSVEDCVVNDGEFDLMAQEEWCAAIAYLELARAAAQRAVYHQTRGIAESQRKGLI